MDFGINDVGTEASFATNSKEIEDFYENNLKFHRIRIDDTIYLSAVELPSAEDSVHTDINNSAHTLVIVAGRAEIEHKYAELLYSLKDSKLRIIVCFVRGQGQAANVIRGSNKCHIDYFRWYREDLASILSYLDVGPNYKMLGFSLGGLISLDFYFNSNFEYKPQRLALIAPFLGIRYPIPSVIVFYALRLLCLIRSFSRSYTPFAQEYKRIPFEDNVHSHSLLRYESYHDYYKEHPNYAQNGPTFKFVKECLKTQRKLHSRKFKFNIPVTCIAAGRDYIVSTPAAKNFFVQHQNDPVAPHYEEIAHAYHDILNEDDSYRNVGLVKALNFLFNEGAINFD